MCFDDDIVADVSASFPRPDDLTDLTVACSVSGLRTSSGEAQTFSFEE